MEKLSKNGDYYRILCKAVGKKKADLYFGRVEYNPYNFPVADSRRIRKLKFNNYGSIWKPKAHSYRLQNS